jgi:hypothetical protein
LGEARQDRAGMLALGGSTPEAVGERVVDGDLPGVSHPVLARDLLDEHDVIKDPVAVPRRVRPIGRMPSRTPGSPTAQTRRSVWPAMTSAGLTELGIGQVVTVLALGLLGEDERDRVRLAFGAVAEDSGQRPGRRAAAGSDKSPPEGSSNHLGLSDCFRSTPMPPVPRGAPPRRRRRRPGWVSSRSGGRRARIRSACRSG